ncbi:MAG TPA: shikimate dehydrogenase [Actinomycetota bacterium]|nr:shikimate dehydrogenase [Actinomycetota bacterium]
MLSGATSVAGIVGGPRQVARSLSPAIHNAGYEALGLDWVYVGFPVDAMGAQDAVATLRGLGNAGVAGFNVTMPHKLAAARAVDHLVGQAAVVGAVNAVEVSGSELVGWNTDGEGLASFLTREAGVEIEGRSLLVIGAGGSARSVVSGLVLAGADRVTVAARDAARAAALQPLAGEASFGVQVLGFEAATAVAAAVAAADIIVNATPVGQEGEAPLIPVEAIHPGAVVVDLVYHPLETPLVLAASRAGATAFGGLGMLVHQAALAFEIFTGRSAPLPAMWAGARRALEG